MYYYFLSKLSISFNLTGVSSLRALLAQDKDEDSPKLHTLLCEAFVSVYLSQLIHALSTCDCHVLYRLIGQQFTKDTWALLFGGGVKVLLHVSTGNSVDVSVSPSSIESKFFFILKLDVAVFFFLCNFTLKVLLISNYLIY